MDGNSEQIREAENAADDRLQRFCSLYDELEGMPDGEQLLARAEAMLKVLAGWQVVRTQPARPDRIKLIFARFAEATRDLIDCEGTPDGVQQAVGTMVDYFANELDGAEFDGMHAYRVMGKVFKFDDGDE